MNQLTALMQKKIAGIPVIYIVGLFVAILAVVAWRMKSSATDPDPVTESETVTEEDVTGDPSYPGGAPTFVANPAPVYIPPDGNQGEQSIDSNEKWMRRAIEWLAGNGHASVDQATVAIQKYLAGEHLSVSEGKLRDLAISHYGLPPEIPQSGGTDEPATPIPQTPTPQNPTPRTPIPPTYYTVTGNNDNTWSKLAVKFYGSGDDNHVDYLQSWNVRSGAPHSGTIANGIRLWIPVYQSPKYITANASMRTAADIIKKNPPLNSVDMLEELNDGMKFPVAVGTRVRVL